MLQSDHPCNTKPGGVAIYYKEHLLVIRRNNIYSLNESIVLEILANNNCFFTGLHGSPSQNKDQLDKFCSSFNMLMSNINDKKPLAFITTGEFNARFKNWRCQDIINSQGSIINTLISTSGYHQLMNTPTHMTNTSSSCIDLNFTSNPSLITEFGIEKHIYPKSYHHSTVLVRWISTFLSSPSIYT